VPYTVTSEGDKKLKIRTFEKKDYKKILSIVEKLKVVDDKTGWFDEDARKRAIPTDIKIQSGFVAEEDEKVLGFITYFSEYGRPKIGWIGVDPDLHRKGIGTALSKALEDKLKKFGAKELSVETPAKEEVVGTSYEGTYKFYEKMGFIVDKTELRKDFKGREFKMAVLKKVIA
jgi:GNAT superfamily N-acetyltransferase